MAPSANASFPFIKTLVSICASLSVHLYCHLRADEAADSAAGAALLPAGILGLVELSLVVAQVVDPGRHCNELTRTNRGTQLAPLASLLVDLYISVHHLPTTPLSTSGLVMMLLNRPAGALQTQEGPME